MSVVSPIRVTVRAGVKTVQNTGGKLVTVLHEPTAVQGVAHGYETGIPSVKLDDGREVIVKSADCDVVT